MFCNNPASTLGSIFGPRDQYPYDEVVETKELINLRQHQSIFASGTGSLSVSESAESSSVVDFEQVQIKVQVLGLMNGIVMETNAKESQKIKDGTSNGLGDIPVFAVVTGFNEVNDKMKIAGTHLPSIPLEAPSYSNGKRHRYMAVWPADFDPQGNPTSCTTFSRKMKKLAIKSLEDHQPHDTKTCMYTTEKLVLGISLMRGNEMITLGSVNVHYTGTEVRSVQANLPVKVTKDAVRRITADVKGKKHKKQSTRKVKREKRSFMQAQSFKGDPKRSYKIDEDALLTVMIETMKQNRPSSTRSTEKQTFPEDIIVENNENHFSERLLTQADFAMDSAGLEFVEVMHGEEGNAETIEDFEDIFHPTDEEGRDDSDENYSSSGDDQSTFVVPISQSLSSYDESETDSSTLVPVDAGAHALLTLSNLENPYTMSTMSSSKIHVEDRYSPCLSPPKNSATVQYITGWD